MAVAVYVIPKNLKSGDFIQLHGRECEILEIKSINRMHATYNMPTYNFTYKNDEEGIKDINIQGQTVIKKIIKVKKKTSVL